METLLEFLPRFDALGDREAIRSSNGIRTVVWSYRDLSGHIARFDRFLEGQDLGRGSRLVLWSENRPEWMAVFWAAVMRGVVVVPVDAQASQARVSRILEECGAPLIVHGRTNAPVPAGPARFSLEDWADLPDGGLLPAAIDSNDVVEILYTSGTTAAPKGVVHRHRNICSNLTPIAGEIARYRRWARPFQPIRFLNVVPLSHMFGQSMGMFIPPLVGGAVAFPPSLVAPNLVRSIRTQRVSVLVSVPRILAALRAEIERGHPHALGIQPSHGLWRRWWRFRGIHRDLGWKFWAFVVGGARLDESLEEFWSAIGLLVVQGYGLTESSPVVAVNHPFRARRGTLGTAIGGQEIRLDDDGEILVRGPSIVGEYIGSDGRYSPATDPEGWFHTGDLGERDSAGNLIYRGRKKDLIVGASGLNIHPEDIEAALNRIPGVRDSAVVPIEGPNGEIPHAVLIIDEGRDPGAVIREANAHLDGEQRIRSWSVWEHPELPRTSGTGKLQRYRVAEILHGRSPLKSGDPDERGAGDLDRLIAGITGWSPAQVRSADGSQDLGLTSLERIELLAGIEQRFGIELDEEDFSHAETLDDIRRRVEEHRAGGAAFRSEVMRLPHRARIPPPRWARRAAPRVLGTVLRVGLVRPLLRSFVKLETTGLEHIEALAGPVIFAATHTSHLDVPLVFRALPGKWRRRLAPAAGQEYFFPPASDLRPRWLLRLEYVLVCLTFNVYPLPQMAGQIRESLQYTGELVSAGYCPLVFPEGKRTPDGRIQTFRPGVGYMASRLNLNVVPIRLDGSFAVFPTGARWPRRGAVRVHIGRPLAPGPHESDADFARRVEDAARTLGAQG